VKPIIYVLHSSNKEQVIILSKKVIVKCLTVLCKVMEFVDLQMGLPDIKHKLERQFVWFYDIINCCVFA